MPPRFKPFSYSLANQGMRNTNRNITNNSIGQLNPNWQSPVQNINAGSEGINAPGGINSKNTGNKGNNAIGIGGNDNQVMGETPWWNWEFGEGEGGQMGGGNIYDPPFDYGGGNTGANWPGDSFEIWQQLQQDMIGSGYIDDIYNFDWTEFQQFVQQQAQQGSTTIYDDVWSMFMDSYGTQDSLADDLIDNTSITGEAGPSGGMEGELGAETDLDWIIDTPGIGGGTGQSGVAPSIPEGGAGGYSGVEGGSTSGGGYPDPWAYFTNRDSQPSRGGKAAKKLHYPGTSGGFASTGGGIGGSTLEDLLKKIQG